MTQAVLRAVREAADALTQVAASERRSAEQRRILAGLDATIRLDRTRIRTGLGSQLDMLETGTRVLAARQAEAGLVADAALRRVQLLTALGGGFTPPAAAEATNDRRNRSHRRPRAEAARHAARAIGQAPPLVPDPRPGACSPARRSPGRIHAFFFAGDTEETDDAYVAGDIVAITAREAGTVIGAARRRYRRR